MELACPHCLAVNRVPDDRLADAPKCGKCGAPLLPGKPIDLTAASFDRFVARAGLPVLVDFWADWCGPCKMMAPQFQQAARLLEPRVRLAKVDTEAEPELGARYGIRSIPTLVLFSGGHELARQNGAMGTQDIVRWATAQLG